MYLGKQVHLNITTSHDLRRKTSPESESFSATTSASLSMGELPAILLAESFDQACLGTSPRMPAQHSEIIIIIIQLNKFFARLCASIRTSGFIDPLSQSLNRTGVLSAIPYIPYPCNGYDIQGLFSHRERLL